MSYGRFMFAVLLSFALGAVAQCHINEKPTSNPRIATWSLPSCPLELTLQNGTRWAMPDWAEPACQATLEWVIVPIKAVPVNP